MREKATGAAGGEPALRDLLQQATEARTLEEVERVCRKLQRSPELDDRDRTQFNSCWEEADLLRLYELVPSVGHRYEKGADFQGPQPEV